MAWDLGFGIQNLGCSVCVFIPAGFSMSAVDVV